MLYINRKKILRGFQKSKLEVSETKSEKMISFLLFFEGVLTNFLPCAYGASVWTNLTKGEVQKMQILQLQFLKRSLQVPRSTSNCVVYLELGVLPVIYEIHARKLTFLHHVLTLSEDDPVFRTYKEQRKYIMERNWANEIKELREIRTQ